MLDGHRSRTRRQQELRDELLLGQASSGVASVQAEQRIDLSQALAGLPPRQRAILVLRYFADLQESEIASILDCAPGTVKSSAARALASLRKTLAAQDDIAQRSHDTAKGAQK